MACVYDAMNRRISKSVNAEVTHFLCNQDDAWADLDSSDAISARYLLGAKSDELLARQRTSDGRAWYLTDHLGTVRDIVSSQGTPACHIEYSSFGQVYRIGDVAVADRFLFTGREFDKENGLYFYRARYYSSEVGRFISQDPVGFDSGDFNMYRYVMNRPLLRTDASGTTESMEYPEVATVIRFSTQTQKGINLLGNIIGCIFTLTATGIGIALGWPDGPWLQGAAIAGATGVVLGCIAGIGTARGGGPP